MIRSRQKINDPYPILVWMIAVLCSVFVAFPVHADVTLTATISAQNPIAGQQRNERSEAFPTGVKIFCKGPLTRVEYESQPIVRIFDASHGTVLTVNNELLICYEQPEEQILNASEELPGGGRSGLRAKQTLKFDRTKERKLILGRNAERTGFAGFVSFEVEKASQSDDQSDLLGSELQAGPGNGPQPVSIPRYEVTGEYWRAPSLKLPGGRKNPALAIASVLSLACPALLVPLADQIASERAMPMSASITVLIGHPVEDGENRAIQPTQCSIEMDVATVDETPLPDSLFQAPAGYSRIPMPEKAEGKHGR